MIEALVKTGLSGVIGFLAGIGLLIWIEPLTQGGRVALLVISTAVGIAAGQIVNLLRKKPGPKPDSD